MGFLDDVGHFFTSEIPTFVTRTIPGVTKDIGNAISSVYKDALGLATKAVSVPTDTIKTIAPIAQTVVTGVTDVSKDIIKTGGSTIQGLFNSPVLLIGGGIVLLLLLSRGSAPKVVGSFI